MTTCPIGYSPSEDDVYSVILAFFGHSQSLASSVDRKRRNRVGLTTLTKSTNNFANKYLLLWPSITMAVFPDRFPLSLMYWVIDLISSKSIDPLGTAERSTNKLLPGYLSSYSPNVSINLKANSRLNSPSKIAFRTWSPWNSDSIISNILHLPYSMFWNK